jgi:hypothetical protein
MWNWLKRIFGSAPPPPAISAGMRNTKAKEFLADLRENELSVGAALRRGESVRTAPGQVSSVTSNIAAVPQQREFKISRNSAPDSADNSPTEDVATSMAVGAATGSAMLGYAVGGSIVGGMVGAALNDAASSSSTSDEGPLRFAGTRCRAHSPSGENCFEIMGKP